MSLAYRPEIDGLRALAVGAVILFHAGIPGFSNGFLGVDIFFVISGFLITSIIAREQAEDGFSYGGFVMRRVRRILPVLVVVMLVSIPFAWWLMLPDSLENFGQSLVATSLSANNILLWLTTGYWDLSAEYKPFLHTWSLGVEEQFYIFYPFILVLALRLPMRACYAALSGLAVLSFVLMLRAMNTDPTASFYMLHYRAWQLLIGGVVGLMVVRSGFGNRPVLAGLGVAMILISLIPVELPKVVVLGLATCGTALYLLWATPRSPVTWIFTRRPVIFVGLLSYSLYLWHQPVFAFLRVAMLESPGQGHFALAILICFVLALLSWRFVEQPFRSSRRTGTRALWSFVGTGMAISIAVGLFFHLNKGFPQRLGNAVGQNYAGMSVAYNERIRKLLPRDIPANAGKPVVLVAGNSLARDFSNVILEAGLGEKLTLLYRDDLPLCVSKWTNDEKRLISTLDMLIYASGSYSLTCAEETISLAKSLKLPVFFGGNKKFGENLNPLLRYSPEERARFRVRVPDLQRSINENQLIGIGTRYINILAMLSEDGGQTIRVANDEGVLLTTDSVHFSKAGAIYTALQLPELLPELYDLVDKPRRNKSRD